MEHSSLVMMLMRHKGKTTTTERMLYYGGHTRRIGSTTISLFDISWIDCTNVFPFHYNRLVRKQSDRRPQGSKSAVFLILQTQQM